MQMGMFKNNEVFHFLAFQGHICLDVKEETWLNKRAIMALNRSPDLCAPVI